jgi:hypothetical protein
MTKREAMVTSVTLLAANFNRETSAPLFESYWLVLSDLGPEELAVATRRALAECKFMPTASELLTLSGHGRSVVFDAAQAWEAVRRAIDKHDYTTSVDFGALVNAIVRNIGGWMRLCDLPREDLDVWARKEFERLYTEFANKDAATLHGEPLAGSFGGVPVRVPIGGKMPPLALPAPKNAISSLVRNLADTKSLSDDGAAAPQAPPAAPTPVASAPKPPARMSLEEQAAKKAEMTRLIEERMARDAAEQAAQAAIAVEVPEHMKP